MLPSEDIDELLAFCSELAKYDSSSGVTSELMHIWATDEHVVFAMTNLNRSMMDLSLSSRFSKRR